MPGPNFIVYRIADGVVFACGTQTFGALAASYAEVNETHPVFSPPPADATWQRLGANHYELVNPNASPVSDEGDEVLFLNTTPALKSATRGPAVRRVFDNGEYELVRAPGAGLSIFVTWISINYADSSTSDISFRAGPGASNEVMNFEIDRDRNPTISLSPPWVLPENTGFFFATSSNNRDVNINYNFYVGATPT